MNFAACTGQRKQWLNKEVRKNINRVFRMFGQYIKFIGGEMHRGTCIRMTPMLGQITFVFVLAWIFHTT